MSTERWPVGVSLSADIERRAGLAEAYRARVRWIDPVTRRRKSKSQVCTSVEVAGEWIAAIQGLAQAGVNPDTATMTLAVYGEAVMLLALRGLEGKTLDPYLAGWRKRVVPALGRIPIRMVTTGAVDRAVHGWIAEQCSRSTVKNSLAVLVRVMEQAVRDGVIDRNPARVVGWQREYQRAEDELDDPRSLALPNWEALSQLATALVARSADHFDGWGDVVISAAPDPMARLFTGPRGGRITTAVLRDATHWDEVVTELGYEHLRRHDLRHTGLTWMADAGVPVHVLRKIAGHGSLVTTQRYLHPDDQSITDAGTALSAHLTAKWSQSGPKLRLVEGHQG